MPAEIVGRDQELDLLRRFVASIADGPPPAARGRAGVGKTTLWRAGVAMAGEAAIRVARASPAQAEAKLAFGSLGDLLEGVAGDTVVHLPVPQRRALGAALLLGEVEGRPDQRTVAVALLNVVRRLAGAGPVLLAVDDVQWLDPASAGALAFAFAAAAWRAGRAAARG